MSHPKIHPTLFRNFLFALVILSSFVQTGKCSLENNPKGCEDDDDDDCVPVDDDSKDFGLRKEAIIGIIVGSLALVIAIPILYCFCCGCFCFSRKQKQKTQVLSATIRSQNKKTEPIKHSENESKIQPISNHFIGLQPRPSEDSSIYPNQNFNPSNRPSEDNSAYWGGYGYGYAGQEENIYYEPEVGGSASAPNYYGNNREGAVFDGIYYPGFNQPPPPYPILEFTNQGYPRDSDESSPANSKNNAAHRSVLKPYLTEL